jgi:hypothetical protein
VIPIKSITVCVGFDDLLAVTLPNNKSEFEKTLIVTSPTDERTKQICRHHQIEYFETDAFYRNGATFNKGLALEEGLDKLGRKGWICIWDSDIVMPNIQNFLPELAVGKLYNPRRRIVKDISNWNLALNWNQYPIHGEGEFAGYFQLFSSEDPVLKTTPWYSVDWKHAGGCDSDFQRKWDHSNKIRLDFDVLHLGEDGVNWHGRASRRLDGSRDPNHIANLTKQKQMFARRAVKRRDYSEEKLPS